MHELERTDVEVIFGQGGRVWTRDQMYVGLGRFGDAIFLPQGLLKGKPFYDA